MSSGKDKKKWKETHVCSKNHEGSSGKMESEGAKRIWERSVEKKMAPCIPLWLEMETHQCMTLSKTLTMR